MNKRKLTFRNYLGFGLGDFAFNLFFQGTALFLLFFYTDILGIEATAAGTIFLIATTWDAISDPAMGILASRNFSRRGRYRPFLLYAALPLGLSYTFMFYQPGLSGAALFYWALALQLLFRTFFTMGNIPYSSLSSEMTTNTHERSKLAAYRMFMGYAGALVVSYLTGSLIIRLGWEAATDGYFKVGIIFAAVASIMFIITYANTFENPSSKSNAGFQLKGAGRMLCHNRPFLLLCAYILVGMAGVVFFYQALNYYFKYVLEDAAALGTGMLVLFLALLLTLPLWLKLSKRHGKRLTLLLGCSWLIISSFAFYANPLAREATSWTFLHMGSIGIGIGCAAFSFWAMLPDTVEYGEWQSGLRAEGLIFGLGLFALKLGLGLGSFVLGQLLGWIGYVPNAEQSASTLNALHSLTTLCVAAMAATIFIIMLRYTLTAEQHRELVEVLS